jgi:hypothetical protein
VLLLLVPKVIILLQFGGLGAEALWRVEGLMIGIGCVLLFVDGLAAEDEASWGRERCSLWHVAARLLIVRVVGKRPQDQCIFRVGAKSLGKAARGLRMNRPVVACQGA